MPGHVARWGNRKRTCLRGRWTGVALACRKRKKMCPAPAHPLGGHVSGTDHEEGDRVTFSCYRGFRMVGTPTSKCMSTGRWSSSTPKCTRIVTCDAPKEMPNAHKIIKKKFGVKGFGPGDHVTYQCNDGFLIDTFEEYGEIMCQNNGRWTTEGLGICTAVYCSGPGILDNGKYFPLKEHYSFQDMVQFECDENHDMIGKDRITCDRYGEWSGFAPECRAITCPDPSQPEYGRRIGSSFLLGDTVSFECMQGFTLRGSRNRTCLPTARWSGVLTICERGDSDCLNPGTPVGAVKYGTSYNVGDIVTFTCLSDFFLEGSDKRVCLKNGMWSGTETFCRYKHSYMDPDEAAMLFTEKLDRLSIETSASRIGSQLRENLTLFTENSTGRAINLGHQYGVDLYLVVDVSGSISQEAVNITKEFCKAIVDKVGVSRSIDGTRVTVVSFAGEYKDVVTLFDEQTTENVMAKIDEIDQHTGSKATATMSALKRVEDYIAVRKTDKVFSKALNAVILLTDGKHNMFGSPVQLTDKMKADYDTDVYTIGIGNLVDEEVLKQMASPGQYLRLKHISDLDGITQFVLNGSVGYEECGVGGLRDLPPYGDLEYYVEAKDIINWPWMAALYIDIARDNTYREFRCGASLVRPQWLLSAAHCFADGENDPVLWEARMGSLVRDNRQGIPLSIAEIIMHPNYSSSPIQHNDVALIKLVEPVILSPTIRTVCLPDDLASYQVDQTRDWYEPGRWSVATGWGDIRSLRLGDVVQLRDKLKFTAMKIQSETDCNKTIVTPNVRCDMLEGMFCAGDGKQRDSCNGDSGGPSMIEVPVGYHSKRVFQVGIVSWGYGCRLKGKYGFYARIEEYLPWILTTTGSDPDSQDL